MINIENIKELRHRTQSSYVECKKALIKANQDIDEAEKLLMEKGLRIVDANSLESTEMGLIHSYVHPGNRVGALVEILCKTDFVAKTKEFQKFTKEIALQVASMKPVYVSREDIPDDIYTYELSRRFNRLLDDGKPNDQAEELAHAEMVNWFREVCLLEQTYIRDNTKIVKELLAELINKTKEPCKIKRFTRWSIGETEKVIEPEPDDGDEEYTMLYNKISRFGAAFLVGFFVFIILFIILKFGGII